MSYFYDVLDTLALLIILLWLTMHHLRTILTCLAIASLLVSDAVVAVHSASCSGESQAASAAQPDSGLQSCTCHRHACSSQAVENASSVAGNESSTPAPEHDCDQCTICRGALVCRFAVVCEAVLPPAFEGLEDWVTDSVVTLSLGREFSTALSERGPPA